MAISIHKPFGVQKSKPSERLSMNNQYYSLSYAHVMENVSSFYIAVKFILQASRFDQSFGYRNC